MTPQEATKALLQLLSCVIVKTAELFVKTPVCNIYREADRFLESSR